MGWWWCRAICLHVVTMHMMRCILSALVSQDPKGLPLAVCCEFRLVFSLWLLHVSFSLGTLTQRCWHLHLTRVELPFQNLKKHCNNCLQYTFKYICGLFSACWIGSDKRPLVSGILMPTETNWMFPGKSTSRGTKDPEQLLHHLHLIHCQFPL